MNTITTAAGKINRERFSLDRRLEFFSETELTQRIGHGISDWPVCIASELIANSLDDCEEHGILPEIQLTMDERRVTVTDNGHGIPGEAVAKMTDFAARSSTKMGYAGPTRGKLGNFSPCMIGASYVVGDGDGVVEIRSNRDFHRIETRDDATGLPLCKHTISSKKIQIGTSVTVYLASLLSEKKSSNVLFSLLETYAILNKHASFSVDYYGKRRQWNRSVDAIDKWTHGMADPVHWYDMDSFVHLMAFCVNTDRSNGKVRTVRDFVRSFAGMSRSAAVKHVLDEAGMSHTSLDELAGDKINRRAIKTLHDLMIAATRPPSPLKLGIIGREHICNVWGVDEIKYARAPGQTDDGLPFLVEVGFLHRQDDNWRSISTGVNFAADIDSFSPSCNEIHEMLRDAKIDPTSDVNVLVHIVQPRAKYTNTGKTSAEFSEPVIDTIRKSIIKTTKEYTAFRRAEERGERQRQKTDRRNSSSLKDAIFEMMVASVEQASAGGQLEFNARNHYYAIRQMIQKLTKANLTQSYLDQVVDEWEATNGIIECRNRDPRGFLIEPHTGKQIPLGTKNVDDYSIPPNLYNEIIYCEKKGLLSNFKYGRIAERYDAAVLCAEGFAVRAAQTLMQNASQGCRIYAMHDADPSGYLIAQKIGKNSGAHKFNFEIIDIGLKLEEGLEMGLPTETFDRKKRLPKALELTKLESKLFGGFEFQYRNKKGELKPIWRDCERIELNALAADPHKFVEFVERKLAEHGANKKLIPPVDVQQQRAIECFDAERRELIESELRRAIGFDQMVDSVAEATSVKSFDGLEIGLARWATDLPAESWTAFVDRSATERLDAMKKEIKRLVKKEMKPK